MSTLRPSLKKRFGTPEKKPHLRIIVATVGPGKAHLLALIRETNSLSEAARQMKMSYKQAWDLLDAMNACFQEPLVETATGGKRGGGSSLSPMGEKVLALYEAIHQKSATACAREMRQLGALLKPSD